MHEYLHKEYKFVSEKAKWLQARLADLPEGRLTIQKNGRSERWYFRNGSEKRYLSKPGEQDLAQALAVRNFYETELAALRREEKFLKKCLDTQDVAEKELNSSFAEGTGLRRLAGGRIRLPENHAKAIEHWLSMPTEYLDTFPEAKKHKTKAGILVRSKSEQTWANALYDNSIPFKYEAALSFGPKTYYPDFTILHPQTLKFFYLEHFGLYDDGDYMKRALEKMQVYSANGLIPTVNLICTYETADAPLDPEYVRKLIEYYFL